MFHRLVDKQEEPQQQQQEQQHLHHHHRLGSHRLHQLFLAKQVSVHVQK